MRHRCPVAPVLAGAEAAGVVGTAEDAVEVVQAGPVVQGHRAGGVVAHWGQGKRRSPPGHVGSARHGRDAELNIRRER